MHVCTHMHMYLTCTDAVPWESCSASLFWLICGCKAVTVLCWRNSRRCSPCVNVSPDEPQHAHHPTDEGVMVQAGRPLDVHKEKHPQCNLQAARAGSSTFVAHPVLPCVPISCRWHSSLFILCSVCRLTCVRAHTHRVVPATIKSCQSCAMSLTL